MLISDKDDLVSGYNFSVFYDQRSQAMSCNRTLKSSVVPKSGYFLTPALPKDKQVQTSKVPTAKAPPTTVSYGALQKRDSYFHWRIVRNVYTVLFLLVAFTVVYQFSQDARNRIQAEIRQKQIQAKICQTEYHENDCDVPRPALRQYCLQKKECMENDPESSVGKLGHTLMVLIEIFNSIVANMNIRSMIVFACMTVLLFGLFIMVRVFDRSG